MKWKIDAEDSCSSLQSNSDNDDEEKKEDEHDVEHRPQSEDHGHEGGSLGRDLGKAGLEEYHSNGFQQVRKDQFANRNFSCSILSTHFYWGDGCIFQRLQTYDSSISPSFPFLLLSWQLKLISTMLQMFAYTSEVAFERRCNCASWPMRRKEQNWRKGDSDQRYQKRFPSWTSRMIKRLIRKSACVSLYSILLSFSSEHLLLSGEEKRMDQPVHILLPALVKPSLW